MELCLENPLTNFSYETSTSDVDNDTLCHLFHLESDHMVSDIYINDLESSDLSFSLRRETISLILQLLGHFDPFVSYLAVNYLDRFFSIQGLPGKPWVKRLMAVACITLALKMLRTDLSLFDFQCDKGLIFDSQTVGRMESIILGALNWRMRSITPFAFLQHFVTFCKLDNTSLARDLKSRAAEIIFKAQNEGTLLKFKPSIVSASATLCAANEFSPIQYHDFLKSITSCAYVNKEKLQSCIEVMEEIAMDEHESGCSMKVTGGRTWSSITPVRVLDYQWSISGSHSEDINSEEATNKKKHCS